MESADMQLVMFALIAIDPACRGDDGDHPAFAA